MNDTLHPGSGAGAEGGSAGDGTRGRDGQGRFAKGNKGGPGNPFARRVAALRQAVLDCVTEQDLADVVTAMLARAKKEITPWTLHDLRRTAVTGMANLGIAPHVVEAVVNHISGAKAGVAGIYNRAEYAVEKKAALARWALHVLDIVDGGAVNVVPLETKRR